MAPFFSYMLTCALGAVVEDDMHIRGSAIMAKNCGCTSNRGLWFGEDHQGYVCGSGESGEDKI